MVKQFQNNVFFFYMYENRLICEKWKKNIVLRKLVHFAMILNII